MEAWEDVLAGVMVVADTAGLAQVGSAYEEAAVGLVAVGEGVRRGVVVEQTAEAAAGRRVLVAEAEAVAEGWVEGRLVGRWLARRLVPKLSSLRG